MYATEVAWSQIVGSRKNQQDRASIISWSNGLRLLLLADGMGGPKSGDIASQCVVDSFCDHFINSDQEDMRQRMIDSLGVANSSLYRRIREKPELAGMGTTLVAAVFDGSSIQWVSIGDSPMWLLRDGSIKRLNQNHSMSVILAEKVASGEMTSAAAAQSPLRSQLLEAIMGEDIKMLDAPESPIALEKGDWLIIASDGVETCSEEDLLRLVCGSSPPAANEFVKNLLAALVDMGKQDQDNATAVVLHVSDTELKEANFAQPGDAFFAGEPCTEV